MVIEHTSSERVLSHCDCKECTPPWSNFGRIESDFCVIEGCFDVYELGAHSKATKIKNKGGCDDHPAATINNVAAIDLAAS